MTFVGTKRRMEETVTLGDRTVRRLGFGAMRLCGPNIMGPPRDPAAALAVLRHAVDVGVQLIDTADAYGPDVSEQQIASALYPYPADIVIATKGGSTRPDGRWERDGRPAHLKAACEGSLQRLRLDRIDLFQLHSPDPKVPFADSIGALKELRDAGKIGHVGLSNVSVDQLRQAREIVPIVSVQNRYNLGARQSEDVLDACARDGLAFLPYFPIEAGSLAKARGPLADVAQRRGATTAQIALAWLLKRSPVIAPIPGTSSLAHLDENLGAGAIDLTDSDFEELSQVAA